MLLLLLCIIVVVVIVVVVARRTDVYMVTLMCFNSLDKESSSYSTITVRVDSGFRSSSSSRSGLQCTRWQESRFVIAENMYNVTLGTLQCRHRVFCTADKQCTLSVLGTLANLQMQSRVNTRLSPHILSTTV